MWQVIRKAQGLSPNIHPLACHSAEEQYEQNQRCILMHEARPPVPYMDPQTMTRAYGDFHYEKIRRWLLDDNAQLRMQATDQLIELFTESREHRAKCLRFNVLPILFSILFVDPEESLRERAAIALEMLVREPAAQDRLLRVVAATASASKATDSAGGGTPCDDDDADSDAAAGDLLDRLLQEALGDESDRVVALALRVVIACHTYVNSFALTQHMVEHGAVERILSIVAGSENALVRAVACSALVPTFDVKEAHILFQRADGMRIVTKAISEGNDDMLVAEAAEVVSRAAEWPQGKRDATQSLTIAALLPHMGSDNLSVRVAVVAALAQITVWEPARFQALETPAMTDAVAALLAREDERDVIAYLAKVIYHLAEHPAGRAALRPCREKLSELLGFADSEDVTVRLALENAVKVLSRK